MVNDDFLLPFFLDQIKSLLSKIKKKEKEKRNRLTDIENKLVVTSGEREGGRARYEVGD